MKLSIVIGTYNRLEQLKRCIESIFRKTRISVKVYVTDAGSTDGTIDYLKSISSEKIIPLFVGERIGQAKAYNDVFNKVDTPYICWLSDDNELIEPKLDTAVRILEKNPRIGMVGLKVKDLVGPFVNAPYIGGISSIGILNVNQGVLPTSLIRKLGGFSEEFRDYGIDADLTAKVLFAGYKIVYTKKIALLHYRNWETNKKSEEYKLIQEKQKNYYTLYNEKYGSYSGIWHTSTSPFNLSRRLKKYLIKRRLVLARNSPRDIYNTVHARYINVFDYLITLGRKYYLVQSISKKEKKMIKEINS